MNIRLEKELDEALRGSKDSREAVMISKKTPKSLLNIGLKDLPILITQKHLRNCMKAKGSKYHAHGIDRNIIVNLPGYLGKPAFITKSLSDDKTIIVGLMVKDSDGMPIIAAIKPSGSGQYNYMKIETNFLASIYGHERIHNLLNKAASLNKILYLDKKKTLKLCNLSQLPLLQGSHKLGYVSSINQDITQVNSLQQKKNKVKKKVRR